MPVPQTPAWVTNDEPPPEVILAAVYLGHVDADVGRAWYELALPSLIPMLRSPGNPAVRVSLRASHQDSAGNEIPLRGRQKWADAMQPELLRMYASWNYDGDLARGPIRSAGLTARAHSRPYQSRILTLELAAELAIPEIMTDLCTTVISVLRKIGDQTDLLYGDACDHALRVPDTALGQSLRQDIGEGFLRGYDWVTMCSSTIAKTLGGAAAMRDSGAFTEVIPLAPGGLLLRATPTPREYDTAAVRRVFEALRPALPPGLPRPLDFDTARHLVIEDARRRYPA